jgi:hypothetical protein
MTILLSSEDYSAYPSVLIKKFSSFLTKAARGRKFQVKVVITYREWLSHMYSFYGQRAKTEGKVANMNDFSEFFLYSRYSATEFFQVNGYTSSFYMDALVENWGNQFGRDNLVLIDYYGMEGARRDIAHVFLCDIMGFLCDSLHRLPFGSDNNVHWNPVNMHFLNILDNVLNTKKMTFCLFRTVFQQEYLDYLTAKNISFPFFSSKWEFLIPERLRLDNDVHDKYGAHMLYSNRTINEEKIRSFHTEQLDVNRVLQDVKWINFINAEMKRLAGKEKICHLGNTVVVKKYELLHV